MGMYKFIAKCNPQKTTPENWDSVMSTDNINGIWFFGLAGSGKSYASKLIMECTENAFIVDGDNVRLKISTDLGYTVQDRLIQINRLLGIGELVIENKYFPIISSVYMTEDVRKRCEAAHIKVVKIIRETAQILEHRKIYETEENVVGKDIKEHEIQCDNIFNRGDERFVKQVKKYVE